MTICDAQTDEVGQELTKLIQDFQSMNNGEAHFAKKDTLLERDMADMIEYVRMITDQIIELRQRTRAAE